MKFTKRNEQDFVNEQFNMVVIFNYNYLYIHGRIQRLAKDEPLDLILLDWIDDKYIEIEDGHRKLIKGYCV